MKTDQPSATAYLIAHSTIYLARDAAVGHLIPAQAAALSEKFVRPGRRAGRWRQACLDARCSRPLVAALERLTLPGIQLHYALRKRYLEEIAHTALADDVRQLIVLGAGFDTLALRLHPSFPAVQFIELDHPATQARKIVGAAAIHARRDNLHFLPLDLTRQTLTDVLLTSAHYDPRADTLFIAEGLLMYLAPDELDQVFEFVRRNCGARSLFAFTFMEPRRDGRIGFRRASRAVDAWLRFRGEPFKWAVRRADLARFLAPRGFTARAITTPEDFRRRYLTTAQLMRRPLAEGECVCVARCA